MIAEVNGPRGFAAVEDALAAYREGLPVLVLDDKDRENEGDVFIAAEKATPEWMGWMIRHTSGYLCAPMTEARADALRLPLMVPDSEDPRRTAYTISVDAASGVTTGISASDRTRTVRVLADPGSRPADLIRPGHILPLRARAGGVLTRGGHTEAAVDLAILAGLEPVGVLAELIRDDGEMMRTDEVLDLGARFGLPVITVADIVEFRYHHDRVRRGAVTHLPTAHGNFTAYGYEDRVTGAEHVALVSDRGLVGGDGRTLVRLHSECLTGDAFGSVRCDCGAQLDTALEQVAQRGGVVVYLRGHEGRGVGLVNKLRAYTEQDNGLDTVDAQLELGLPVDAREYGAGVAILADLGVSRVQLMTNNPEKIAALAELAGDRLDVVPFNPGQTKDNAEYLRTKRDRMGHHLDLAPAGDSTKESA